MGQVFKSAGLSCPYLDHYVARREELFQELCTPSLNRVRLKQLFLHGGFARHMYDGFLPFLIYFERELKSCTEKLLECSQYRHIRALLEEREVEKEKKKKAPQKKEKKSILGKAIALI